MDIKIEVVDVPVSDVDASKAFYVDKLGFHEDIDVTVTEGLRFVQLTPPGSKCSVVMGEGLTDMEPGSQRGIMAVIANADDARAELVSKGVEASDVDEQDWGRFVYFKDPDGNAWTYQQLPQRD
jgi:catechol 2,3-dioxygenase-like lactoylglutathione lyase family enzyme